MCVCVEAVCAASTVTHNTYTHLKHSDGGEQAVPCVARQVKEAEHEVGTHWAYGSHTHRHSHAHTDNTQHTHTHLKHSDGEEQARKFVQYVVGLSFAFHVANLKVTSN